MLTAGRYLLSCCVSLSLMDVNFYDQNPCMLSWHGVLQFGTLLSVILSESGCIFALEPSSGPCNSFLMLFIHSVFLSCSFCSHILLQNCLVSFVPGCWFDLEHFPPTCWKNFLSLFWSYPGIFWFSFPTPISFDLFLPFILSDLSTVGGVLVM